MASALDDGDYPSNAPPNGAFEQALQQYPILRDFGVVGGYGKGPGYMEFWPPGEGGGPNTPRPDYLPMDKPGVEVRSSDARPIDVLGDVVSHHMVYEDPTIKQHYQDFKDSLTPDQMDRLQRQYNHAVQNSGEDRSYEEWADRSGIPGYFRGYAFKQWPDDFNQIAYTPEQRQKFDQMMSYLTKSPYKSAGSALEDAGTSAAGNLDFSKGDILLNPINPYSSEMQKPVWTGPRPKSFDYPVSPYTNPFLTPEYGYQSSPTNPIISDRPSEIPPGYSETRGEHSRYRPQRRRM
jgi:hypothetical protein